jgi:hypothetical protein
MSYGMFIKAEYWVRWNHRHAGLSKKGLKKFLKTKKRYARRLERYANRTPVDVRPDGDHDG